MPSKPGFIGFRGWWDATIGVLMFIAAGIRLVAELSPGKR